MTAQSPVRKPLAEQIFHEMFATLEARKEFDRATIDQLKHLAASGDLAKAPRVIEVIKSAPGAAP